MRKSKIEKCVDCGTQKKGKNKKFSNGRCNACDCQLRRGNKHSVLVAGAAAQLKVKKKMPRRAASIKKKMPPVLVVVPAAAQVKFKKKMPPASVKKKKTRPAAVAVKKKLPHASSKIYLLIR